MKLLNRKRTLLVTFQLPRSKYAGALLGWKSWIILPRVASISGTDFEEDIDHQANQEGIIHKEKTGAQEISCKEYWQKGSWRRETSRSHTWGLPQSVSKLGSKHRRDLLWLEREWCVAIWDKSSPGNDWLWFWERGHRLLRTDIICYPSPKCFWRILRLRQLVIPRDEGKISKLWK